LRNILAYIDKMPASDARISPHLSSYAERLHSVNPIPTPSFIQVHTPKTHVRAFLVWTSFSS
jgi:hypothetical protein